MKAKIRTVSLVSEVKVPISRFHQLLAYVFNLDLPLRRHITMSVRLVEGYGALLDDIVIDNYGRKWHVITVSNQGQDFTLSTLKPISYEISADIIVRSVTEFAIYCHAYAEGGE